MIKSELIKEMKREISECFCFYEYIPDKQQWKHPQAVCLPICIEQIIDKYLK